MKKKLTTLMIVLLLTWPAMANDDEIVEFLDFFENMELVEDENFKELVDDNESELDDDENDNEEEENA